MNVALVTDSTAYIPADLMLPGITVVPVQVVFGHESYEEGVGITLAEVAAALREWKSVSTSRPSPYQFEETYRHLADQGYDGIVSVHLSAELSGTWDSAVLASRASSIPVEVVDSRTVGMGAGFAVLEGARLAAQGASREEVAAAADRRAKASRTFFYVDSLEYLRRGGRIGAAQALVGSALGVKPILQVLDGSVAPYEKVRTAGKALSRMAEIAVEAIGGQPADVAVQHIGSYERADALAAQIRQAAPSAEVICGEMGAVIGAHVGPGMVSVTVSVR